MEIVLRADRLAFFKWTGIGFSAMSLGWYVLRKWREPWTADVAFLFVIAVVMYALWPTLTLVRTGKAVVLTDQGLVNYTGGFPFVAWSEVSGARLRRTLGSNLIELDLHDPEAMLQRMSPLRGWFMRSWMSKHGGKPTVYASYIRATPEEVLGMIKARVSTGAGSA